MPSLVQLDLSLPICLILDHDVSMSSDLSEIILRFFRLSAARLRERLIRSSIPKIIKLQR